MSLSKKEGILPSSNPSPTPVPSSKQRSKVWLKLVVCLFVSRFAVLHFWHLASDQFGFISFWNLSNRSPPNNCPQAGALIPEKNGKVWIDLNDKIGSAAFKQTAIDWLAGAIRIPWVSLLKHSRLCWKSFDKSKNWIIWWNGPSRGRPSIWSICSIPRISFGSVPSRVNKFYAFIHITPELIYNFESHSTLNLTKVNTYGLWYEWKGSDTSLKPILLAAHQGIHITYSADPFSPTFCIQTWFLSIQILWTNGLIPHTQDFSMVTLLFS